MFGLTSRRLLFFIGVVFYNHKNVLPVVLTPPCCVFEKKNIIPNTQSVGAAGPILGETVKSISLALDVDTVYETTIRKSFVLSSDQAHALHPNYAARHEKNHQPYMNGGMVIKRNSNQRYATTSLTGVIIREIARRALLPPVQEFVIRQDCGCGSTIGPLISTATGIRAIDMGCPQLSMHSIREQMGICDRKFFVFGDGASYFTLS